MLAGLYFSFTNYPILSTPQWTGLANYEMIVKDPLFWQSLFNTAFFTVISVPLAVALALVVALLVNQQVYGTRLFRTIFFMPTVIPTVATTALFIWFLQPEYGLLNVVLSVAGIKAPDWLLDPNWTKPALILFSLWGIGNGMIIFLAGLQSIPEQVREAAAIDGANSWIIFWRVTLPLLSPTTFFTQAYILGSLNQGFSIPGGPLNSLLMPVVYIFLNGFFYFKMGYASALAWILFVIIGTFTLIQFAFAKRWVYYEWDEVQ